MVRSLCWKGLTGGTVDKGSERRAAWRSLENMALAQQVQVSIVGSGLGQAHLTSCCFEVYSVQGCFEEV